MINLDNETLLSGVSIFSEMPPEDLKLLADQALTRKLERGTILFHQGDPGEALYVILSGLVKVYQVDETGRQHTLAILENGDFFGEMAIFDGAPRSATAEALTESAVLILKRDAILGCLRETPEMAIHLLATLSRRIRQANTQVERFLGHDVKARVAGVLLDMLRDFGKPPVEGEPGELINLLLTHQELANLAGTARETVTRTLCEMQDSEVITFDGRKIRVLDKQALKLLCH